MNPLVFFIRACVYLLVAVELSMVLFIVLKRAKLRIHEKRFRIRYKAVEEELLAVIAGESREEAVRLAKTFAKYGDVLTAILLDYAKILFGPVKELLNVIFRTALEKKTLRDLASRRTMRRLRATRLLSFFIDARNVGPMLRLMRDKPIIRLAAVQALSRLGTPETPVLVFQAFETDPHPNMNSYMNIFLGLGNKIETLIREALIRPMSLEKTALLIELVGTIPLRALYPDLLPFGVHQDKEIRVKAARALGGLLIPDSTPVLIRMASDEAWEVQAQAVKSLGKMKSPAALETLTRAFYSPNWYVRFNARGGLVLLGEAGIRRLEEIAFQTRDAFAAAMAAMTLRDLDITGERSLP